MPGAHKKAENRFDFLPNLIKKLNVQLKQSLVM